MMEMRQVRHLLAVVEKGSYVRAAEELNITQSALTQSISRLEAELGVKLLDRGRFGAVPTEAGRLFLSRAKLIDAEARLARLELDSFKGATRGDVTIGVGKSVVQRLVPEAISRFMRQRPDVVVTAYEAMSSDLFLRLLRGELDFVVSAAIPQVQVDPDLSQKVLFEQHEVVVVGADHPLASRQNLTLKDLAPYHWVVPPTGTGRVKHLQAVFRAAGAPPPTRFVRSDSIVLLQRMVARGSAIALATVELLNEGDTELRQLDIPELTEVRRACLTVRRRSRLQPLAAALAQQITQAAAQLSRGAELRAV